MATIFNEDNTIEQMMLSTLQKNGWKYIPAEELPRMYSDVLVEPIVLTGVIDDSIEINFNVNQIQEEKKKIEFLTQNPDCTDEVFELEDHNMLKGQISIIGLDNLSLGSRFSSLFACSWDKIDCALMTLGNYGQQERNKWRYQFASKSLQYAWDELFHKSANAGFENTHTILVELLKSKESFDDGILDGIISAFLAQCEKDNLYPWNYYYVKYPVFRPGSYGKMSNDDVVNKLYMFSVMQTKTQWSQNTYMYAMYMSSLGNRPDLFPQSGYVSKYYENPPADYEVPAALLGSDEKFARLMEEADKYVGFPYVWGGSTPETSFDCSGFVSYVLTNSGLYNTGRLGAQGLYNISTPVSNPQPGDLVFFTGTYDTPGVSHVGIYVGEDGDGSPVMLHCGDPIQYSKLDTSYWQSHFYAYGRLNYN